MRAGLLLFLILSPTAQAMAAPSLCAALPTAGKVAQAGRDERAPALRLPDRRLACAPGFALDTTARPPSCRRPATRAVDGDPRAACRASLALGPIAELPAQWRPTRSCASGPIRSIVRLEGMNAGLAEVTLTALSPGITVTTLDDDSKGLPAEERPAAQGCFGHACRLVALEVAADATDPARLELAIADGETLVVPVPLTTHCPR